MKRFNYLFLMTILTFGCGDEVTDQIQSLKEGEYVIKLYNTHGDLLLTKKGNAENLVTSDNHWEIRLLYPDLDTENTDPLDRFATLTMGGQSKINQTQELIFNKDNTAGLNQRWYSLDGDWGYLSTNGTLMITEVDKSIIKGNFEIGLEVDGSAQQNPNWGEHILAKGYFSSICPYDKIGGCP